MPRNDSPIAGSPGSAASSSGIASERSPSVIALSCVRSAPAQKPRPAPVSTITTTRGSDSAAAIACFTSAAIRLVQALSWAGRFSVMVAIGSSTS